MIHISQKNEFINVVSNLGYAIEVDTETLAKWNKAISEWWNVQLEMDKYIKEQHG